MACGSIVPGSTWDAWRSSLAGVSADRTRQRNNRAAVGFFIATEYRTFKETTMKPEQVKELLLQSLEHERGGIQVYETALECVQNDDLREEWEKYLEETRNHERVLAELCEARKIAREAGSPRRDIVRMPGEAPDAAVDQAR